MDGTRSSKLEISITTNCSMCELLNLCDPRAESSIPAFFLQAVLRIGNQGRLHRDEAWFPDGTWGFGRVLSDFWLGWPHYDVVEFIMNDRLFLLPTSFSNHVFVLT